MQTPPLVRRKREKIVLNNSRVITRPYFPGSENRNRKIVQRVLNLTDNQASEILEQVFFDFSSRHKSLHDVFNQHFQNVCGLLPKNAEISDTKKALIGAYFTMEYSIESAALFNPSIIPHPDQSNVAEGEMRFVMSFRATGEGHISSIEFRSGIIDKRNNILFDPTSEFVETPDIHMNPTYNKHLFQLKLNEMDACNEVAMYLLDNLADDFNFNQLIELINHLNPKAFSQQMQTETIEIFYWLAKSNYELNFNPEHIISERVIFPVSENESSGIEDARFVRFVDENGKATYYATYTAYNGIKILPQLIETKDFISFTISTLNGLAVQNKGMALFPRKINGQFVMLSRQDGENNHIMFSDNSHFWQESYIIQEPSMPWEFIQIGNCGSPLETEEGWLVLTHGVGPVRKYCIGAILLDLDNPSKMIGRLPEPLLRPREEEREGYVPNVVYSCGSIIHNEELIIPYAMSDFTSGIATVSLQNLLNKIERI